MAELPPPTLEFDGACPDCGRREAVLPLPLPGVEDDFDWKARDYNSIRLFLMQELASRFPERRRWTPADMEVMLVELIAAALDRLSHSLDRVQAERFLDSARRPGSVRRLLRLIGWEPSPADVARLRADEDARLAAQGLDPAAGRSDAELVEAWWRREPQMMEAARRDGPRRIAEQRRMVTLADHADRLAEHPMVALAQARLAWTGAWASVLVSVLIEDDLPLDDPLHGGAATAARPDGLAPDLWDEILAFHGMRGLPVPSLAALTPRTLLRGVVDRYRMIGTEVFLEPARAAPIAVTLSVRAKPGYFRSELKRALAEVFTADQGGFFEPGRLRFGEAIYASDIIEAAMAVEGVSVACLNMFRRIPRGWPDRTAEGVITVEADEFIQCMQDPADPSRGTFGVVVNGGEPG